MIILQQTVELPYIARAEAIVVVQQDVQCLSRSQAKSASEDVRETHSKTEVVIKTGVSE